MLYSETCTVDICYVFSQMCYGHLREVAQNHDTICVSYGISLCVCVSCRLDTKDNCDKTIEMLNGSTLQDSTEPLLVKFADSSSNKKRQHGPGRL